ncbi:uncharacterized protein CLAFUR5_08789 [Fulvia fulva]|uniref:Uncharacterized protein n=1 Tax=Passalora fulva TaxID=5499 RepID=A0A9Q8LDZ4_PASFU|nr:uncharacterized protein CLAFUR5_08789 [Fulvia fulva]KAK4629664.1 hypothetical protein CLAFUR4_08694 [Fulvia fulva]KAK4630662.1 hypothetical protein CLAFUR0_08690 [Fulvia fulva]UJO15642.1 hypothetical protein CLAFUR5_08789 [Fulvia fulva]WPV27838.1 hypothetical protein CLAFUW7_08689 [Fulvia fulva]
MAGQVRVPYADGMTEGQGYNSYLQQTCVHDAVTVNATQAPDTPMNLVYESSEVKDYNELLQTLDISAGAGLSGWGSESKIDSKFLDKTEIKQSLLTYVVKVDAQCQPSGTSKYEFNWEETSDPQGRYGDRFISGFVKGGALFARVSIITNEKSTSHELQVAAKTVFPVYSANAEITSEVKESIEKIHKSSEVKIYLHYVGTPTEIKATDGADNDMQRLKEVADAFYNNAPKHTYKRFALLERYTNISNFNNAFQPLDYSEAKDRSWPVFGDFTECLVIQTMLRAIDSSHYTNGRTGRDQLDTKLSTQLQLYRSWVEKVSKTPAEARSPPGNDPQALQNEILRAVKKTKFIAQSMPINAGRTHFIDDHRHSKATELFSFEAYDFDQVMFTTKIIFGRALNDERYIALIGRKTVTPGYEQTSQLWGFDKKMNDMVNGKVVIEPISEMGIVRLELKDATPCREDEFSFYIES